MKRHLYTAQLVHEFGKSLLCCLVWCWSGRQSGEKGGVSLAWKELVMEPARWGMWRGKLHREEGNGRAGLYPCSGPLLREIYASGG